MKSRRKTACDQKSGGRAYQLQEGKLQNLRHDFSGRSQSQQSEQDSTCALCRPVTQLHLFRNKNFLRSPGRVGVELFSYLWNARSKPAVTDTVGSRSPVVLYYHSFKMTMAYTTVCLIISHLKDARGQKRQGLKRIFSSVSSRGLLRVNMQDAGEGAA